MNSTSEILKALDPRFVALDELEREATPINLDTAQITEEAIYACPLCAGDGEVEGKQYINFDGFALNVCFSGIGAEHGNNEKFVLEARKQNRPLLDAHAQALVKLAEREWKPIAEAPKDGSWILLFSPNDYAPRVGRWCDVAQEWLYTHATPTHFHPLPQPPAQSQAGEGV